MGKNISGVGIDPNITGRIGVAGQHDDSAPQVSAMVVCDLTDETHGNAIGVGLADVITRRLFAKIDYDVDLCECDYQQLSGARQDSGGCGDRPRGVRRWRSGPAAMFQRDASGSCASSTRCISKRSTYRRRCSSELSDRESDRDAGHRLGPLRRDRATDAVLRCSRAEAERIGFWPVALAS